MLEPGIYDKDKLNFISVIQEYFEVKPSEDVGAIFTFLGITRREGADEKEVDMIEMESYKEHANITIKRICEEVGEKYGVPLVRIYHLVGKFKVGEPLVFVVVGGRSRNQALQALEEAINRYKTEPALWKKEIYIDGTTRWISH